MAKYYYKKYESVLNYSRDNEKTVGDWNDWTYVYPPVYDAGDAWTSPEDHIEQYIRCDLLTGYYIVGLSKVFSSDWLYATSDYVMVWSPSHIKAFNGNGYRLEDSNRSNGGSVTYEWEITPTRAKGAYVGEVIAEDGTYPTDGYNASDGYYYVRGRMAVEFYARVGGAWVQAGAHVRVGGAWKTADVHPRVNGAWVG